jgi:hypothetical protein
MIVRFTADGGAPFEPSPSTSSPNDRQGARRVGASSAQKTTRTAVGNYNSNKPATKQTLEVALWNEALSTASAQRLLNDPMTYQAESAKLQGKYAASLPKGVLDSAWASAAANARAKFDQAATTRALREYGQAKPRKAGQPNSTTTTNAQKAALAQVMDDYMAQHGQYFIPGTASYANEEQKALDDPKGLVAAQRAFTQKQPDPLRRGVKLSDLATLAEGGERNVAHQLATARARAQATALETNGFDQEVRIYEHTKGRGYASPGSAQWNIDAQSLLNDPSALIAARDAVAAAHAPQLAALGLNMRQLGADLWVGETVAQAKLTQQHDDNPPPVCTANGSDTLLSPMERQKQGEWDTLTWLSDALNNLTSSGVDPTLARQTLMANGYVASLAGQINKTMQAVAASKGNTTADGITFLDDTVRSSSIDPQLATLIVGASATTLQRYLKDQSKANAVQAAQAFVSTAGIYYALQTAGRASVQGAAGVAENIERWSYGAANETSSIPTPAGRYLLGPSPLEQMLQQVLSTAQQQKVAPNLFYGWVGMARPQAEWVAVSTGPQPNPWATFRQSLNTQLAHRPLPSATPLTQPSPVQTPDQVHENYDRALTRLEQNGGLPSNIEPAAAAAAQTMIAPGYVAARAPALARAMIAGESGQLDAAWLAQHPEQGLTMPVDFFTAQAAEQLARLHMVPSTAIQQALRSTEAPLPTAPSSAAIARTTSAFAALERAKASGDQNTIATAQQAMNQAIANELLSVYSGQFAGNALLTNDENSDWRVLAEEQVARDHADDPQLASQLPALLEAGEITQTSIDPGKDPQSVAALDASLAPFQQPGGDPGNAIAEAVLNDARVRDLITRQIMAATAGIRVSATTTKLAQALAHEAALIAPYELSDPNGPVARQIVQGTVAAPITQQLLRAAQALALGPGAAERQKATHAKARPYEPLPIAAPLMQAAENSPTLTLAVFNALNDPGGSHPANALLKAAGNPGNASEYRDAAIVYAALPDDPQVDGVAVQLPQAQADKSTILTAFGHELRTSQFAARDVRSWIRDSFIGPNSAPDWLAQDLVEGYHGSIKNVPGLTSQRLVSAINAALYQTPSSNQTTSATPPSPDFAGRQNTDGLTLQEFSSDRAFDDYVAAAYGARPMSGSGATATYNLSTKVYGDVTLATVIGNIKRQAGVGVKTPLTSAKSMVLQAMPVEFNGQLVSAFRVQTTDGTQVWIGPDGRVTQGWQEQDALLTGNPSNTVVQVVGGVSEADAQGNANPLLKINTPPPPPVPHRSMWVTVAEDAGAMVAGAVITGLTGNPLLGAAAAFIIYQAVDTISPDGSVTLVDFSRDLAEGKASWHEAGEFYVSTVEDGVSSLADGLGPWGAELASGAVAEEGATFLQRVAATAAGATTNQAIQGTGQIVTSAMEPDAQNRLTGAALGHVALEQAANLVPAALTGGLAGALPANLLTQGLVGLGSNLAQADYDDRLFEHHGLTRDDVITAAIYLPATTAIDVLSRPGGFGGRPAAAPPAEGEPRLLSVAFGRDSAPAFETAVADGQLRPGKDWAYVYRSNEFRGYAEVEPVNGKPLLVWRGKDPSTSKPFNFEDLREGRVGVVLSDARPEYVLAGGQLPAAVRYSKEAMAYRASEQGAGGPGQPVREAVARGVSAAAAELDEIAAAQIREAFAAAGRRVADAAAAQADRQGFPRQRADALLTRMTSADVDNARTAAEGVLEDAKKTLVGAKQNRARLQELAAEKKAQADETRKTGTGVDDYAYRRIRRQISEADKTIRRIERQMAAADRQLKAAQDPEAFVSGGLRTSLVASIRESTEADQARLAKVAADLDGELRTKTGRARQAAAEAIEVKGEEKVGKREAALQATAIAALVRELDKAQPDSDVGVRARLRAFGRRVLHRPDPDPLASVSQAMDAAVTARAKVLARDEARRAADRQASELLSKKRDLTGAIQAGEERLAAKFRDPHDAAQFALTRLANGARDAARSIEAQTGEDLKWAEGAKGLTMSQDFVNLLVPKVRGNPGGFYDEAPVGLPRSAGKWLIKQYQSRDIAYLARLNNELLQLGLGPGHLSEVRVINDAPQRTSSRLLANVQYPEPGDVESFERFFSRAAAQKNGLDRYWAMALITGAAKELVGESGEGVGFIGTRATDLAQFMEVDSALGARPDGTYKALPQTYRKTLAAIRKQIADLTQTPNSPYVDMPKEAQIESIRSAVTALTKHTIDEVLGRYGDLGKEQVKEIRKALLLRRRALLELYPEAEPKTDSITRDDPRLSKRRWARRLKDVNLSATHGRSWSIDERFAETRRFLRGRRWEVLSHPTGADAPDVNYEHQPIEVNEPGVQAKVFRVSAPLRLANTGKAFGGVGALEAFLAWDAAHLLSGAVSTDLSDLFSITRGFLNTGKLQGKVRKIAISSLQEQTDLMPLIGAIQNLDVSLERTLGVFERSEKYITVPPDAKQRLRYNTEDLLGALVDIVRQGQGEHQTLVQRTLLQNELNTYFAAQDHIMGIGTADAQFLSQATNPGFALQVGLGGAYVGTLTLDIHKFVLAGIPHTVVQWLATLPSYINDFGKIGSLLNAVSAAWARWTTEWPYKPDANSRFVRFVKRFEPVANVSQGIGNFFDGLNTLTTALSGLRGLGADYIIPLAEIVVGRAYFRRGLGALRGSESEEQDAKDSAASALGTTAEGVAEFFEILAEVGAEQG